MCWKIYTRVNWYVEIHGGERYKQQKNEKFKEYLLTIG